MLNKVILMGRITRDLVVNQTPSGVPVLTFTIAVERSFVRQGEERQTDFITCVAWRNQAEFISRYFAKGRMIAIVGNLRTRNYEKDGVKHYVTEVYVDEASFTGEPRQQNSGYQQNSYQNNNYQSNGYQQENRQSSYNNYNSYNSSAPQPDDPANIGDIKDFETFNEDGIPF